MDNIRINRIAQELKKVLSQLIAYELNDPKVNKMTTVTEVRVSNDLSYADIYVSVMGTEWEKKQTLEGLDKAQGYLKNGIAKEVKIRQIPELRFHLDNSLEYGLYMDQLISKTLEEDRQKAQGRVDSFQEGVDE